MKTALILCMFFPSVFSRMCWGFSDMEYEGRIDKTDKIQITCAGDYCMTLSEEGSDFNVYNGTCPDKTVTITDCETRGVGCAKEKLRDVYVNVCCCNYDLCNASKNLGLFTSLTLIIVIVLQCI